MTDSSLDQLGRQSMSDLSRLKELVEVVLPAVPDDSFSLEAWVITIADCKTVCCACGWAAHHKPFTEAGLQVISGQLYYTNENNTVSSDYLAASEFFDITVSAACYLFHPDEYPEGALTSKQEVIDRISQYLRKNSDA